MHLGSTKIGGVYRGSTKIGEVWKWDGAAWRKVYSSSKPLITSRLTLSADQAGLEQSVYSPVKWSASTGHPVNAAGALIIGGDGPAVLTGVITINILGASGAKFRIMLNGALVAEYQAAVRSDQTIPATPMTLRRGDLVTTEAFFSSSAVSYRKVIAGSWVQVDPA